MVGQRLWGEYTMWYSVRSHGLSATSIHYYHTPSQFTAITPLSTLLLLTLSIHNYIPSWYIINNPLDTLKITPSQYTAATTLNGLLYPLSAHCYYTPSQYIAITHPLDTLLSHTLSIHYHYTPSRYSALTGHGNHSQYDRIGLFQNTNQRIPLPHVFRAPTQVH